MFSTIYNLIVSVTNFKLGKMSSLQGPVVCPLVHVKQTGRLTSPIVKAKMLRSTEFWGFNGIHRRRINVVRLPRSRISKLIVCSFNSSSNDSGGMAGNFKETDADYVNSSVVEAGMLIIIVRVQCHISLFCV